MLLLERLREVNALLGFTRVEAPEESSDPNERPQMASLARRKPDWVPANQVHGEGISDFRHRRDKLGVMRQAIPHTRAGKAERL